MSKESALAAFGQATPTPIATTEVTEGSAGVTPTPSEKPQDLQSTRIALLIKKEAEAQKIREEAKRERELVLKEREALSQDKAKILEYDEFQSLKAKDKVAALKRAGFSHEDIVNALAEFDNNLTPEQRAERAAQAKIDEWQAAQTKKEQEAAQKRNQQVFDNYKNFIGDTITKNLDKFELCSVQKDDAVDIAFSMIEQSHKETGETPALNEILEMVEEYLENEASKYMSTKKFAAKRTPEPEAKPLETKKEEPLKAEVSPRPSPSKTLSTKTTATSASTTVFKKESHSEKKARLAAKLASFGKDN